jgi:hypothetical protein
MDYIRFDSDRFEAAIKKACKEALKEAQQINSRLAKAWSFERSGVTGQSGLLKWSIKSLNIEAGEKFLLGIVTAGNKDAWWGRWVEFGSGSKRPRGVPWTAPGKLPERGYYLRIKRTGRGYNYKVMAPKKWPLGPNWPGTTTVIHYPLPGSSGLVGVRSKAVGPNPPQPFMLESLKMASPMILYMIQRKLRTVNVMDFLKIKE